MSGPWSARAEALAEDIREPGHAAAESNARAWSARCAPEATAGLVAAAMTLTNGDAGSALWQKAMPLPDDKTLIGLAEDIAMTISELLQAARRLASACETTLEVAQEAYISGQDELLAALARLAAASSPEAACAAEADIAAAQEKIRRALEVLADCETALEILSDVISRLQHSLNCIRRVPEDLAATYEAPYQLVKDGGQLPWSGDFLTGSRDAA